MRHVGIPQRARRHRHPPRHHSSEHRQRHVRADADDSGHREDGWIRCELGPGADTVVYMCLTGTTIADIVKETGIQIGEKSLTAAIKKIPGAVLTKINQKMGFRFLTKFGEKGVINLGKLVPIAGGLIGGGVDIASTIVISRNAIRMFIKNETLDMSEPTEEEINAAGDITVEATD